MSERKSEYTMKVASISIKSQGLSRQRMFDLFFSTIGVIMFSPFYLLAIIAIFIEDRGSPFFKQDRIGQYRIPFLIIKFRTMNNGKVTKVGKWLRSTGLDETAQFLNVLKGDMSMIGPRPLTKDDIDRLGWNDFHYDKRWSVKPGVSGLSQMLAGKSAIYSWKIDQLYMKKKSFSLDVRLLFLSLLINIFGKRRIRNLFLTGSNK